MELRHLRYFVAVAEEGSLTNAAERRLHTAQPSLSRQIRDLELEVGVPLLERGARGISLTAAGRTFSIMRGWRYFRLMRHPKPRAARRSLRSVPSRSAFSPARNWSGCRRRCASCAANSRTSISRWRASHRRSLPAR